MSREGATGWTGQSISQGFRQGGGSKAAPPSLGVLGGQAGGHGALEGCWQHGAAPCQAGVCQQRDGISSANKHPWLQAQRIQIFLAAAGVQLPQRLNKPKQATKEGLGMGGCCRGVSRGRAFTWEQSEAGRMNSASGSELAAVLAWMT